MCGAGHSMVRSPPPPKRTIRFAPQIPNYSYKLFLGGRFGYFIFFFCFGGGEREEYPEANEGWDTFFLE